MLLRVNKFDCCLYTSCVMQKVHLYATAVSCATCTPLPPFSLSLLIFLLSFTFFLLILLFAVSSSVATKQRERERDNCIHGWHLFQTSGKRSVETTDLTRSFGWDSSEGWFSFFHPFLFCVSGRSWQVLSFPQNCRQWIKYRFSLI